jgi:tetratricopeptide (TPR) repeat protein
LTAAWKIDVMSEHKFISRFSPNRTEPEILERILVQRHELLDKSVALIAESATTRNKHHLLFVGPRGCGKTHLITLIFYRLQQQPDLSQRLRIAWLNEDETSTTFLDLLVRIYRALSGRYPDEFPQANLEAVYGRDPEDARQSLSQILLQHLGKCTLLVLVENLDAFFKQLDEPDQRNWRAFIQDHPVFATVATAQSLFSGVSDRDQPFFGFFDTRHLQSLTVDEAVDLLRNIAQLNENAELSALLATARGRARVRAIHHLSGGNHRLYIVLSEFITAKSLDELVRPFEVMVDEQLTPYFQERLRWLSPQQRKIVEFLCFQSRSVPVKDIAGRLFLPHTTVASQLMQLREYGYVQPHPRGRESLYEITEPLMRLSMQVKETHDREPLKLIVDFLRVWYDRGELEDRLFDCPVTAREFEYLLAALGKFESGEVNLRHQLLREEFQGLDLEHCDEGQIEALRQLAEETNAPADWWRYGGVCLAQKKHPATIVALGRIIESPEAPAGLIAHATGLRAVLYAVVGRDDEAITDWLRVKNLAEDYLGESASMIAPAFLRRGIRFWVQGQHEKAVEDSTRVIGLAGIKVETRRLALLTRGAAFASQKQSEKAIADLTQAMGLSGGPALVSVFAALYRGVALLTAGRTEEAVNDFTMVVETPDAPMAVAAAGLIARGFTFVTSSRIGEAIADFERCLARPRLTPGDLARAKAGMAVSLLTAGRWDEGINQLAHTLNDLVESTPAVPPASDSVMASILREIGSPDVWRARVVETTALYAKHGCLNYLGNALVWNLSALKQSVLKNEGLEEWLACWESAAAQNAELQLPVRLLRSGIAYLKTRPRNEAILLDLPSEERRVVREALGLPAEQAE